jgi:hypothetical protein
MGASGDKKGAIKNTGVAPSTASGCRLRGEMEVQEGKERTSGAQQDGRDKAEEGNSERYLLPRLDRDRPDLAAKMVTGEMTANWLT